MDKMDKNSEPYKDGRYSDLFEAAESANVVGEDAVLYSQSLANLRAMKAGFEYRYEEGREEGMMAEKENMARRMKAAGSNLDFIALITELPPERIREL